MGELRPPKEDGRFFPGLRAAPAQERRRGFHIRAAPGGRHRTAQRVRPGIRRRCPGRHGNHLESGFGIAGMGIETCRPLGAGARRECRILLVGAGHNHSVVEGYCGANTEVGIWRVATLGCLSGFIHKEAFSVGEPVVVKLVISDGYLFSFHQSAKCWVSPLPEARLPLGRIKLTLKIQKKRKSKRKIFAI